MVRNFLGDHACATCAGCVKGGECGDKMSDAPKAIGNGLTGNGYARFDFRAGHGDYTGELKKIQAIADTMPWDTSDGNSWRARLYGRATYIPWAPAGEQLHFEPGRVHHFNGMHGLEFTQPAKINSVANGRRRVFKAFPDALYKNRLLLDAVETIWAGLPFDPDTKASLMSIGFHLIKLAPAGNEPAVASPDLVHRDGEQFTAALLINRQNATGGFNAITHTRWHDHCFESIPCEDVFAKFTLDEPLQGYVVQDDRVAHYVSGVSKCNPDEHAERTILLIDFTPLRPALNLTGIA